MKFVASRDFANVSGLGLSGFTGPDGKELKTPHPLHVPKGARFSIGNQETVNDLSSTDKLKVVQLLPTGGANCAVFESDKAAVAKIDREVAQDRSRAKIEDEAKPATFDDLIASNNQVIASIGKLAEAQSKAK